MTEHPSGEVGHITPRSRSRTGRAGAWVSRAGHAPFAGSPVSGDPAHDAALLDELIDERAAIVEFDGGFSRREAQEMAARGHGFAGWDEYQAKREGAGRSSRKT